MRARRLAGHAPVAVGGARAHRLVEAEDGPQALHAVEGIDDEPAWVRRS